MDYQTPLKLKKYGSAKVALIGFAVSMIAFIITSFLSLWHSSAQSDLTQKLYQHPFNVSTQVLKANAHLIAMHRYMKDVVIARDNAPLQRAINLVDQEEQKVLNHLETAKQRFLGEPKQFMDAIHSVIDWRPIREDVIKLSQQKEYRKAADITLGRGAEHVEVMNQNMEDLVSFAENMALTFANQSQQNQHNFFILKVVIFTFFSALLSAVFFITYNVIRKSEYQVKENAKRYQSIYNNVAVSIWEEDFSYIYNHLENLRQSGIDDFVAYTKDNPELIPHLAESVKVKGVNTASLGMFTARSEGELISSITKTFGDEAMGVFSGLVHAIWSGQKRFQSKANYLGLDGHKITGVVSVPIPQSLEESKSVPIVIEDISDQQKTESQLNLAASVFTAADEGICITDKRGNIIDVNNAFSIITGYTRDEVIGKNPREILKSGFQDESFYRSMWSSLLLTGAWRGEIWNRKKDGQIFPEILSVSAVYDQNNQVKNYVALFSDISHIKQHEEELIQLSHFDSLTTLPNRVLFSDRLRQSMSNVERTGRSLAVAYIDLDRFKEVNDTYGHEMGDDLLVAAANRMKSLMRSVDTLARIGGDEFVAVYGNISDEEEIHRIIKRLLDAVSQEFYVGGRPLSISISIGVTFYNKGDEIDADQLQRQADQAMYEAKLAGRNTYRIFDHMQSSALSRRYRIISEFKIALQEGQLELFYQPKVNMRSGTITGAEALIRWNHPEHGLLTPDQFLPEIEPDIISIELGEWVIDQTLSQIEQWMSYGFNSPISVNIGALQLQQKDFLDRLEALLYQHPNVPPQRLELEILETSALEDFEWVAEVIHRGKDIGVSFALDDFGSGYSSLIYLKKLPVNQLKIDQEFVRSMLDNPEDEAILKGVLGLAKNFNMSALAEGVETIKHGEVLLSLGCELGQGYAIGRPLPAPEFLLWLEEWQPDPLWLRAS